MKAGDLLDIRHPDGRELRLVLAVEGTRALCVDLLDGMCGGWLDILGTDPSPLDEDEVEQRLQSIVKSAALDERNAATAEDEARSWRRSAERKRAIVDHARKLAHAVKARPRAKKPDAVAAGQVWACRGIGAALDVTEVSDAGYVKLVGPCGPVPAHASWLLGLDDWVFEGWTVDAAKGGAS